MIPLFITLLFSASSVFTSAFPTTLQRRNVTSLNEAAFEEAQKRDNTATRAFSAIPIKTSSGQCLFVDELSGDFRANLTPVQVTDCDDTVQGQQWDIITAGVHDNQAGTMLVVSSLTQACLNFDPRRAAGDTVILFSCGGRGDGGGTVTNSQLFNYTTPGATGPLTFQPLNQAGTCLVDTGKGVIDEAACEAGDQSQLFTFVGTGTGTASATASASSAAVSATSAAASATTTTSAAAASTTTAAGDAGASGTCNSD